MTASAADTTARTLASIFPRALPIVAVLHLPPLMGYAGFAGTEAVIENALRQLEAIEAAGMDGVLVENEYDLPHRFTPGPECVATFAIVCHEVACRARIPVGGEILAHHPQGSLASVKAVSGRFVRTDFFVDRVRTDGGVEVEVDPDAILAYRAWIGAGDVALWTDVQVKYSTMLEAKSIAESARQAEAAGSDGIVVTGRASGDPPVLDDLRTVKAATTLPVIVGSGLDADNAADLLGVADAALVGTSLKTGTTIDRARAERLMTAVARVREGRAAAAGA